LLIGGFVLAAPYAVASSAKSSDLMAQAKADETSTAAPATPAATTPAAAGETPAATGEPPKETANDPYLTQRKNFYDACTRICKLLREGNYDSAVYLSRSTADDLTEHKVDGSDPFPKRGADLLQILKDSGGDTDALDKSFHKEAKLAETKGEMPRAQIFFYLIDQLENGGHPQPPLPEKIVVNNEANEDAVRLEMRYLHAAVKKYGRDHAGKYPTVFDNNFKKYFLAITLNGKPIGPFINPFTKKPDWFEVKPIDDLNKVSAMTSIPRGKIWYCPLTNGADYAIIAGDHVDHPIKDPKTNEALIISKYIVEDKTIKLPDTVAPALKLPAKPPAKK
jgi:hypothetical protein